MHVLFVEPAFPRNQREFARALHQAGARVTGIGESRYDSLDGELRSWLDGYEQVRSVVHEPSLFDAVRRVQEREWVDRLEATVEAHILPTAKVREAAHIPGLSYHTSFLCRDKPAMKQVLREAGIPCARSTGAKTPEEVIAFAESVGYPVIVKPRASAGAAGTSRADDRGSLERIIHETQVDQGAEVAVEEYIEGHEGFLDTLTIDGKVVHEFITHYYPGVLEAMRTRWISPQFVATNRIDAPGYEEVRELGRKVIAALGITTAPTHMEWFASPKGLKFSEIGCRPPGVGAWDLHCAGNDLDLYGEWAMAVAWGRPSQTPSRRYAAGMIALRPTQDGTIAGYEGVEALQKEFGEWIIDSHFPPPGTPTQPVEAGYMANAWVRMKHPDYDHLRRMLDHVGQTVKVIAR